MAEAETIEQGTSPTAIETALGYTFADRQLFQLALTHRSYVYETPGVPIATNERLEFLGDAVLDYVVADYLYDAYPALSEGALTSVRSALVKAETLSRLAKSTGLGAYVRLGKGEEHNGGREREPILSATFEAVIGALSLEAGMTTARELIVRLLKPEAEQVIAQQRFKDDKSLFQELAQAHLGHTPTYRVVAEEGPPHQRTYTVEVLVGSLVVSTGSGKSKQRAQQEAARAALAQEGWRQAEHF